MLRGSTRFVLTLLCVSLLAGCAEVQDYIRKQQQKEAKSRAAISAEVADDVEEGPIEEGPASPIPVGPAQEPGWVSAGVYPGTDRFLNPQGIGRVTTPGGPGGDVILNFADADVRDVIRTVLGDLMGVNYVIDPEVVGTITVQTSNPITREALLPTLESILNLNNAAIVREGDVFKVVRWEGLREQSIPVSIASGNAFGLGGYGVQVVPLRYVPAAEMAKILEPFAPSGSILKTDPARNMIILAGTRDEQATLLDAISLFDVDWMSGMSFGLFPLQNADSETLVAELEQVFGQEGITPAEALVRFTPVDRLNAILVITPRASYLDEAESWIERLDQVAVSAGQRVYVYYVQNVRAAELAEVLQEVFAIAVERERPLGLAPGAEAATIERQLDEFDTEAPPDDPPEPVMRDLRAPDTGGILFEISSQVRIIADEARNAIVVLATPQEYRIIEEAMEKLDIVPLQVLIEATVVEVTLNDDLEYGVQWFFDSGASSFTLSEVTSGAVASAFPGFSYFYSSGSDIRVTLNALASITDIRVISSPQLMVLDNQTAELQVGDQVPIATQSAVSVTDPDAPIVNSIEFRDTGVILRVTPRVNASGLVVMDIEQEVSDVVPTISSGIDSPTIRQRRITSSVAIQSGETVTLGGLITDDKTRSNTGVPLLSQIPILGALFGRTEDNVDRTELLVLINPRVVRNAREAREVTEELRRRLGTLQPFITTFD